MTKEPIQLPDPLDPPVLLEPTQDGDMTAFVEALIAAARDVIARRAAAEQAMVHSSKQDKAAA